VIGKLGVTTQPQVGPDGQAKRAIAS